jgi:hypothetical protein
VKVNVTIAKKLKFERKIVNYVLLGYAQQALLIDSK